MAHPSLPSSDNGHRPWSKQRPRLVWLSNVPASCGQLLHDEFLNMQAVIASPLRRAGRHHRHVHIAVEFKQQARRLRNILACQLHRFATDVQSWNLFTAGAEKADILFYFHMYQQIGSGIHDVPFKMEWSVKNADQEHQCSPWLRLFQPRPIDRPQASAARPSAVMTKAIKKKALPPC